MNGGAALQTRLASSVRQRMAPPPKLAVSEWADRYRYLSREASAEPGKWRTDRAPYLRGMMDALSEPLIDSAVAMTASQIGKTEILLNAIGYYADQDPAPMMVIQPSLEIGQAFSKDRVAPMTRDTPRLKERFADAKTRTADNTILHKTFPGGHLTIVGANSPAGLASRPIRILLCDEVDRYPASAGTEGDPVTLGTRRTTTFWNRKVFLVSSPTIRGFSRIEAAYHESDQRQYFVTCFACGRPQVLRWRNVHWEAGQPGTAHMTCSDVDDDGVEHGCGQRFEEADKSRLLEAGAWIAKEPGRRVAGFHLSALYSPWARWSDLVDEFLKAHGNAERMKAFTNTVLAETWQEDAERVEAEGLLKRREDYGREVPAFVGALTAGCDVQADRVEILVRGWGEGEQSALVHVEVIRGDPTRPELWQDVERVLLRSWDGMRLSAVCIDSGYLPESVYKFVAPRQRRRVFATKGQATAGMPIISRLPKKPNRAGVKLLMVGTDSAKDLIYLRLKIIAPGAGCYHWPLWADSEYFQQITSEHVITKYSHGIPYRVYEKDPNRRNEALDLEVLAYAALLTLGPTMIRGLGRLAAKRLPPPPEPPPTQADASPLPVLPTSPPSTPRRRTARPSRWVGGWK